MRRIALAAACLVGCNSALPASQREGCHYVVCGDLLDGFDAPRCGVFVDGRQVANYATGQEALDFIRTNHLRTCEAQP